MREEFRRRRAVIVEGLNRIPGFTCRQPHGAFYAFPNIRQTGKSSRALADALLNEAGVACLWGTAFGAWARGICASHSRIPWRIFRMRWNGLDAGPKKTCRSIPP